MSKILQHFRKHERAWMAGLILMALVSFIVLGSASKFMDSSGNPSGGGGSEDPVVATWKYGDIKQSDVDRRIQQRAFLNQFFQQLDRVFRDKQGQGLGLLRQRQPVDEESAVNGVILTKNAEELGITCTDEYLWKLLSQLAENRVDNADVQQVIQSLSSNNRTVTPAMVLAAYRSEVVASLYYRHFTPEKAQWLATPAERFEMFRRVNRRMTAQVVALPVEKYVAQVPDPSDAELQKFFDDHKEKYAPPRSPEIGFRQPPRTAFEYLRFDWAKFLAAAEKNVTEEEVRKEFDQNKANYRKRVEDSDEQQMLMRRFSSLFPFDAAAAPDAKTPDANTPPKPEAQAAPDQPEEKPPAKPDAKSPSDQPAAKEPAKETPPSDKPAEKPTDKPAEKPADKPADKPTEKPAGSPEKKGASVDRGGAPVQFAVFRQADKPADAKTTEAKPTDTKPADAKPADAKLPADKPAEKPADKPAEKPTENPADAKTEPAKTEPGKTDAKPDLTKPEPPPGPPAIAAPPEPERTDAEVFDFSRQEITRRIAAPRAAVAMYNQALDVQEKLDNYSRGPWEKWRSKNPDAPTKDNPQPFNLAALANPDAGVTYHKTDLHSLHEAIDKLPEIVKAIAERRYKEVEGKLVEQPGAAAYVFPMAGFHGPQKAGLFSPKLCEDPVQRRDQFTPLTGEDVNRYLIWRVDEQAEFVPALDATVHGKPLKEQVKQAWKLANAGDKSARKLALAAGEEIATGVNRAGVELRERFREDKEQTVVDTGAFTWLSRGLPLDGRPGNLELTKLPEIEDANYEFLESVFKLDSGKAGAYFNESKSHVYVVQVKDLPSSNPDELRRAFTGASMGSYLDAGNAELEELVIGWNKLRRDELNYKPLRELRAER